MSSEAKRLGGIELLDADEQTVKVESAWAEKPAVLVFIRHFG